MRLAVRAVGGLGPVAKSRQSPSERYQKLVLGSPAYTLTKARAVRSTKWVPGSRSESVQD
jgi:hypothetical protein